MALADKLTLLAFKRNDLSVHEAAKTNEIIDLHRNKNDMKQGSFIPRTGSICKAVKVQCLIFLL